MKSDWLYYRVHYRKKSDPPQLFNAKRIKVAERPELRNVIDWLKKTFGNDLIENSVKIQKTSKVTGLRTYTLD